MIFLLVTDDFEPSQSDSSDDEATIDKEERQAEKAEVQYDIQVILRESVLLLCV